MNWIRCLRGCGELEAESFWRNIELGVPSYGDYFTVARRPGHVWLPILWALSTFLIQFGLKKNNAKLFNEVHVVLILVVSAMAFVSFFGLFLLPLGMWYPSNAATH